MRCLVLKLSWLPYLANDILLKWCKSLKQLVRVHLSGHNDTQVVRAIEGVVIGPYFLIGAAGSQLQQSATRLRLEREKTREGVTGVW